MLRTLTHLLASFVLLVGPLACCCTVAAPRAADARAAACCCCQQEPARPESPRKTECSCKQKQPYLATSPAMATGDPAPFDLPALPADMARAAPLLQRGQLATAEPWFRTSQELLRALQTLRL